MRGLYATGAVSRFVLPGCAVRPVCSGSAGNSGCVGNLAFPNSLAHRMRLLSSSAPAPDGASFLVAEHQRVVTLYHLARKDEISFALFDFRAGERDFITLAEAKSHVREKGLGT